MERQALPPAETRMPESLSSLSYGEAVAILDKGRAETPSVAVKTQVSKTQVSKTNLAKPRRRLAHEVGEKVDSERRVRRLEDRDAPRSLIDHAVMLRSKAGGPDQDRPLRRKRSLEMALQRGGGR
jgi:hypothetical protein